MTLDAAVLRDRTRGALLGLAIGDALGTTLEFAARGSFTPIDDLVGGGPFRLPAGAWTDDTSMALCLADSLVARGGFDPRDQLARYVRWCLHGERSATGDCFDIGMTVEAALWAFDHATDFRDGALRAVNLGEDADTVGAIYGQLAGAYWGESGLPADWRARLVDGDAIVALADKLFALAWAHRFPDDAVPPLEPGLEATYHDTHFVRVDAVGRRVVVAPHDAPPAERPDWDLPASFHVITAANPRSEGGTDRVRDADANAKLEGKLKDHGAEVRPIDATAPDGSHVEPSFAVWDVPAGTLAHLARTYEQHAFFEIVEHRRGLGAGLRRPGPTTRWLHAG
jgi:hypothetical protein